MQTVQKDVVILDLEDSDELAEFVSRLSAGDRVKLMIDAKFTDAVNKTATFSVEGVKCKNAPTDEEQPAEEKESDYEDATEGPESEETGMKPAALEWAASGQ